MKRIADILTEEMENAFEKAGYDRKYAKAAISNRPDLCEYQCNGAMAAAREYHKAPIQIAKDVTSFLQVGSCMEKAEAAAPGFINITVDAGFLSSFLNEMSKEAKLGVPEPDKKKTIIVDYGGANVAKPLHVGHLRPAIIGESIKRIGRYAGHHVIGDVHLGDWGYQMGLIITELEARRPDLPYFDEGFKGEYPKEPPFTIAELEEIYPTASAYAKEHEEYRKKALKATYMLQNGHKGYMAVWRHIMDVSVADLKKNYKALDVEFDLWKGEADAQPYIPGMVERLKEKGYARMDQGALVVDVKEEGDTREIPPCMILKSDGASLYATTDLATLVWREKLYRPDQVIYITDKRQELHFIQVFRCAKKTGIVRQETGLIHIGFGTMNGKDGKPFKTRDGGVMRLEYLISGINEKMYKKIAENPSIGEDEAHDIAGKVGLAALKYGDLSNQASKDYIFDVDRFISTEGNTGPYILYTIVRIKSILAKYDGRIEGLHIGEAKSKAQKALMLECAKFNAVINEAYEELAPHKICAYIYDLANEFNRFYNETRILSEEDNEKKAEWIALLVLVRRILEACTDMLGFKAPERM